MHEQDKEVLKVYKKVNPSTYDVENQEEVFDQRKRFMENLYINKLHFPPQMFNDAKVLEFGSGTGEHSVFYLRWGAKCTFVEFNSDACKRAEMIFNKLSPESDYKLNNMSLFDYDSDEMFDIVVSRGVLHHTHSPQKGFYRLAERLKPGGFVVLGIGSLAGNLQRNIQKFILYSLADSEEEIVALAEKLFKGHIDRCEKYGKRYRKAIIYDAYVNPAHDFPTQAELLKWFSDNDIRSYTSWPPVSLFGAADAADRQPMDFSGHPNMVALNELFWTFHRDEDPVVAERLGGMLGGYSNIFYKLLDSFARVTPDREIEIEEAVEAVNELLKVNYGSVFEDYVSRITESLTELERLFSLLKSKDVNGLADLCDKSEVLFKGTSGVGLNHYVGVKNK